MYGKAFCVLIIVLILIYNLATGSVETVASSNTETLTSLATYGTLVQAGAAVITLGIMVWLGYQQKEMTRRQVNLSLYEKRFEIYQQVLKFYYYIEEVKSLDQSSKELDKKSLYEIDKNINGFNGDSFERKFLLDDKVIQFIEDFRDDARKFHTLLCRADMKDPKDSALLNLKDELSDKYSEEKIYLRFKHILDLKNI